MINAPQWRKKKPFYEAWYVTFNDDQKRGYWFRYTILDQVDKTISPQATAWAFVFDPQNRTTFQFQKTFESHEFLTSSSPIHVEIGKENLFSEGKLRGNIDNQIRWRMTYQKNESIVQLVPPWIRNFPFVQTRFVIPFQNTFFTGHVEIGNKTFQFKDAPGTQAHIWGRKQARQWVWGHCNAFNRAGYSFEILTAQANSMLPMLTFGYFKTPSDEYFFQNPFLNRLKLDREQCTFFLRASHVALKGTLTVKPHNPIDVVYTDVSGKKFHCFNSEVASSQLVLMDRKNVVDQLFSHGTTHFEWASRK